MSQRVAIVTGGIGGLGSAICRKLAESGRTVIAADLGAREDRIAEFRAEMADLGDRVQFEALNVADEASCNDLVARVVAKHGRVDVLVNAAGITRDTTLRKMTTAQWQDLMRVNLDGVFHMSRAVVEGMCERGFGRIVNISSVNGQTGQFGQTNYSASKAGLHGFTMALAREVARKGVTVNSVSPGYCRTAMVMSKDQTGGAPVVQATEERRAAGTRYGVAHWLDVIGPDGRATLESSPGKFGFLPWIDRTNGVAGVYLVVDRREGAAKTPRTSGEFVLTGVAHALGVVLPH